MKRRTFSAGQSLRSGKPCNDNARSSGADNQALVPAPLVEEIFDLGDQTVDLFR